MFQFVGTVEIVEIGRRTQRLSFLSLVVRRKWPSVDHGKTTLLITNMFINIYGWSKYVLENLKNLWGEEGCLTQNSQKPYFNICLKPLKIVLCESGLAVYGNANTGKCTIGGLDQRGGG